MSTSSLEIPRDHWKDYFNDLSKTYSGWAVTVEVLNNRLGDQTRVTGLPLQGLSFDPEGSQAGDILVEAGDLNLPFETHLVHRPARAADGDDAARRRDGPGDRVGGGIYHARADSPSSGAAAGRAVRRRCIDGQVDS